MIQHTDCLDTSLVSFVVCDLSLLGVDLCPERLVVAKELGADFQRTVKGGEEPKKLAETVEAMLGVQPHVAIECTGVESSLQMAIYV